MYIEEIFQCCRTLSTTSRKLEARQPSPIPGWYSEDKVVNFLFASIIVIVVSQNLHRKECTRKLGRFSNENLPQKCFSLKNYV